MTKSAEETVRAIALVQATNNQYEVPSRINCEHPVTLGQSKIPGAGRGIFVLNDVKEGGLVFEVPNVLLSVVIQDCLATTCDYCFAHLSAYGPTDPRPDLSFTVCETCKVVSYCSIACNIAAWAKYHQYECPNLTKIVSSDPESVVNKCSDEIRTIVRLLSLQAAGMISDQEWEEIMGLNPQPALPSGFPLFAGRVNDMKTMILKYDITKLSMEDVEKIIRAYFNNRCYIQLWAPVTSPSSSIHRDRNAEVLVAECLEPFYSMINHCCIPNCTWVSEGRTLQVRAEKDIAAGEELTICYLWYSSFQERQAKLSGWIEVCTCNLCLHPPKEPTGRLRADLKKLISAKGPAATPSQGRSISLLTAICQMEQAGFGIENWPMRYLYSQLFHCRCGQYDGPQMLRTCLKLYFFVEPAMQPPECLANRNRSLTVLAYLLDLDDPTYARLEPYPEEVVRIASWLHYQLRVRLLHDIRQCNGPDSYMVKYEEEKYEKDFGQLERVTEAMIVKRERDYVPLFKSAVSKWAFVQDMNSLLAWAELPARSESQLLTIHSVQS